MRRLDGVLRWNPKNAMWEPLFPSEVPFFMRRPHYALLRTPAQWLIILFWIFLGITVVAFFADVNHILVFDRWAARESVPLSERSDARDFFDVMKALQALLMLWIAVFFLWWLRRATCNAPALGPSEPEFSPGWSIGWWFVPFANWVQPARVVAQAWRVGDPSLGVDSGTGYRRASLTPWIPIWWITYAIGVSLWAGAWDAMDDPIFSRDDYVDLSWFALATDVIVAASAGMALWVVHTISQRQDAADDRLDVWAN